MDVVTHVSASQGSTNIGIVGGSSTEFKGPLYFYPKRMLMRMRIIACCLLLASSVLRGQQAQDGFNKGDAILVSVNYAVQWPGADLRSRFGFNFNVGGMLEYITYESNWIFGLQGGYLFGNTVKEDVLLPLLTFDGGIIGNDRRFADIQLRQRGFFVGGHVGKLVNIGAANPRSGLRLSLGAGLLQHFIRIQDDPNRSVFQLSPEYKKGYDRLANGFALQQFIGYQVLSRNKLINFYIGGEFTQGFTRNRRSFDFNERRDINSQRIDLLYGIRVGWILPFYFGRGSDEIYY